MIRIRTLAPWVVLFGIVMVAAAIGCALIQRMEDSAWLKATETNSALGALAIIAGLAVLNVGVMVGIGVCTTRART